MSTALEILNVAYRDHNLQEVTNFSTGQEFPFNIAKDMINEVIRDLNRMGDFWFSEFKAALAYSSGVYQYDLSTLGVDPRRVTRLRTEATDYWRDLTPYTWKDFQNKYRKSAIQTARPIAWASYNNELQLNTIPDQDYSLYAYHYKDMPLISATTDSQSSGAILVPENDEDLLQRGCYLYLGYKIGKWTYMDAYGGLKIKAAPFLVDVKSSRSLGTQMPANF